MCQRISLCSPRVLSLRFPLEKAMTLVEKAGWIMDEREPSHRNQETPGDALGSYDLCSSSVSRVEIQEKDARTSPEDLEHATTEGTTRRPHFVSLSPTGQS